MIMCKPIKTAFAVVGLEISLPSLPFHASLVRAGLEDLNGFRGLGIVPSAAGAAHALGHAGDLVAELVDAAAAPMTAGRRVLAAGCCTVRWREGGVGYGAVGAVSAVRRRVFAGG